MANSLDTEKMLEEALIRNLVKKNHAVTAEPKQDSESDSTSAVKKLLELKLLEMEFVLEAKKQEEKWIRKREVRQSQIDRMEEARKTIALLGSIVDKGQPSAIVLSILDDCYKILANITEVGKEEFSQQEEDKEELIHLTSRDIKHSLSQTNIFDVMRTAKKNGWDLRIVNGKLFVYKNGKKVCGKEDIFIPCEKETDVKAKKNKAEKASKFDKLRKLLD